MLHMTKILIFIHLRISTNVWVSSRLSTDAIGSGLGSRGSSKKSHLNGMMVWYEGGEPCEYTTTEK